VAGWRSGISVWEEDGWVGCKVGVGGRWAGEGEDYGGLRRCVLRRGPMSGLVVWGRGRR
jgi:hypothetical protein